MTETDAGPRPHEAATWPLARTCPFSNPPEYATLRAEQPIASFPMPTGSTGWLVTKHADVQKVLLDSRVTSDRLHPSYPVAPIPPELVKELDMSLVWMDPPVHTERRAMLIPEFTVKRMRALRPRIQEIVDEHIDAMLEGDNSADLMTEFSLPVPSLIICELLGVPREHHAFVQQTARSMISSDPQEIYVANRSLLDFMSQVVADKEQEPTDDLFGRLIEKNKEAQLLDRHDMTAIAKLLLLAGHETSANMISLGVVGLLQHPEQLEKMKADPELTPDAVEELLRYFSITDYLPARGATADIELDGVTIREGDAIMALCGSGNRDESVYPEPDKLDIMRKARNHLAFGHGAHQCLGQNLARMELEIVYNTLFRRIPTLELAVPVEELPFKDSPPFGLSSVPVRW
ncbi:cytochrome P450 [Amycolatopsis aidingensis]|uniref:cytochrome P450 n=1 Tax=Amycolatopsis aidingensis TaxID=2842453 RepID=UPI001C0BD0EE|nr:cytochrome P450 [Amycolatopsis aidingensis]